MRWMWTAALAAVMTLGTAACGDDDGPTEPPIPRAQLAGSFEIRAFAFDPAGSVPEANVLEGLAAESRPRLVVSPTSDAFQLVFRNPETGLLTTVTGTYRPTAQGLVLTFPTDAAASTLLLPRRAAFTFDATTRTLAFADDVGVPRSRLVELVPEFADEQFPTTVTGRLTLRFVPEGTEQG